MDKLPLISRLIVGNGDDPIRTHFTRESGHEGGYRRSTVLAQAALGSGSQTVLYSQAYKMVVILVDLVNQGLLDKGKGEALVGHIGAHLELDNQRSLLNRFRMLAVPSDDNPVVHLAPVPVPEGSYITRGPFSDFHMGVRSGDAGREFERFYEDTRAMLRSPEGVKTFIEIDSLPEGVDLDVEGSLTYPALGGVYPHHLSTGTVTSVSSTLRDIRADMEKRKEKDWKRKIPKASKKAIKPNPLLAKLLTK